MVPDPAHIPQKGLQGPALVAREVQPISLLEDRPIAGEGFFTDENSGQFAERRAR